MMASDIQKASCVVGVISIFLPWVTLTSRFLGVTSEASITLLDVLDLSSNIFGRALLGQISYAAYLFIIGCIVLWFHKLGALIQSSGFLYAFYIIVTDANISRIEDLSTLLSGSCRLGFGFFIAGAAVLLGLYGLLNRRTSFSRRKGRIFTSRDLWDNI